MSVKNRIAFATAFFSLISLSSAYSFPVSSRLPNFSTDGPSTTRALQEGTAQLSPLPFVVFCIQYPAECTGGTLTARVDLTPKTFGELNLINQRVNASIRPQADESAGRFWKLDVNAGDCNEYAVQKRHELIASGWPVAALSLTVAKTTWGEGHLLLMVRTNHGDLVLDSLRQDIVTWDQAHYRWIMRQSARNVKTWVALELPARSNHHHELPDDQIRQMNTAANRATTGLRDPRTGPIGRQ